jgi:heptosyltransferase-2
MLRLGNVGTSPLNENLNDFSFVFNYGIKVKNINWLKNYSEISLSLDCPPLVSPKINLNFDHTKIFEDFLKTYNVENKFKYISIQADVWSGESFKAWPYSKVAELCNMLYLEHNLIPIVLGVSSQNNLSNYIKKNFPGLFFIDAIGSTDIKLASVIIKNSCLTLANDSGIMHLSCSLGVPTLAIYGMTDPNVTFVYETSNKHRIMRNIRCKPCFALPKKLMLSCKSKPCLNDISVDEVFFAITEMIKK